MNSTEFITSGLIEAYVMGLCTPLEKTEVEAMRRQHPDVNAAILQFEAALETQFSTAAASTTAALDAKILNSLHTLNNAPVIPLQHAAVKKINWYKAAAAAAVLLFVSSAIFNYSLYKKTKEQELALENKQIITEKTLPLSDYSILKKPAITPVAMLGVGLHAICRCTMFWDKETDKAYIMIHHLVPSSPDNNYQLWATVNGKPVSVGLINDKIRDRFIELNNVPKNAEGFTVTLEKAGGSNTPTEDETYLAGTI